MKKLTVSHSASQFFSSPFTSVYQPIKVSENNKYGATIEINDVSKKQEKYVTYDEDGNLIEVEMAMDVSALSFSIIDYVKKNYTIYTIKEASEIIELNGTLLYKVILNGLDLFFDSNSNFIRSIKNQMGCF
jgi:YD repeat-containing protein